MKFNHESDFIRGRQDICLSVTNLSESNVRYEYTNTRIAERTI